LIKEDILKKKINEDQTKIVFIRDVVNEVITLQEASDILGIADSTLRKKVLGGEFDEWEYRKTSKVILFNKDAILDRKARNKL
jgi:hypothetical protein